MVEAPDGASFPGPCAAALARALFRRYEQGNMVQIEHVRQLITGGLVKPPELASSGVVVAVGEQFASSMLAQDMTTGFVGPAGSSYEFVVLESLCPRIMAPEAICALESGG